MSIGIRALTFRFIAITARMRRWSLPARTKRVAAAGASGYAPEMYCSDEAFDVHLDRFESGGARIFSLEIEACPAAISIAHVSDADAMVRIAERDAVAAGALSLAEIRRKPAVHYRLAGYAGG